MQIYWNKRKRLHIGTPKWPSFHVLGHQYGRRDVSVLHVLYSTELLIRISRIRRPKFYSPQNFTDGQRLVRVDKQFSETRGNHCKFQMSKKTPRIYFCNFPCIKNSQNTTISTPVTWLN